MLHRGRSAACCPQVYAQAGETTAGRRKRWPKRRRNSRSRFCPAPGWHVLPISAAVNHQTRSLFRSGLTCGGWLEDKDLSSRVARLVCCRWAFMPIVFEWNERRSGEPKETRGQLFGNSPYFRRSLAKIFPDEDHSVDEYREIIIGRSPANRLLVISFTEFFGCGGLSAGYS